MTHLLPYLWLRSLLRRHFHICLCAIFFVSLTHEANAQLEHGWFEDADTPLRFDSWQGEGEFKGRSIFSLAQGPMGYLWVGSDLGVFRFDGNSFTRLKLEFEDNSAPLDFIWELAVIEDWLWIGTNHGVIRYHLIREQATLFRGKPDSHGATNSDYLSSPVVAALLIDGILRGVQSGLLDADFPQRFRFEPGQASELLSQWSHENPDAKPDAIYLDPMFPHKKKSALVKKEMRLFQQLIGPDSDADNLLQPALELAQQRVVVKRPDYAPFLADKAPTMQIKSKKHRFDVYLSSNKT